jgi:hypothetical protein
VDLEFVGELKHGFGLDLAMSLRPTMPIRVRSNSLPRERSHGTPPFQRMTKQDMGRPFTTKGLLLPREPSAVAPTMPARSM